MNLIISGAIREGSIGADLLTIDQGGKCCEIINMNKT